MSAPQGPQRPYVRCIGRSTGQRRESRWSQPVEIEENELSIRRRMLQRRTKFDAKNIQPAINSDPHPVNAEERQITRETKNQERTAYIVRWLESSRSWWRLQMLGRPDTRPARVLPSDTDACTTHAVSFLPPPTCCLLSPHISKLTVFHRSQCTG